MAYVPPYPRRKLFPSLELVALGVSAEVVVIVEDEDACFCACCLAIEVRRCQAADAAADNNQIVGLAGVDRLASLVPKRAVAQAMRGIE